MYYYLLILYYIISKGREGTDVDKDEVFHIPQAQRYCLMHFRDWDDKITTPPGLYVSYSLSKCNVERCISTI